MSGSRSGWLVLSLLVPWLLVMGCEDAEPATWKKVDTGVKRSTNVSPEELERMKADKAKRHVQQMRDAFVLDTEETCKSDADCVVTTEHCCTCPQGGRKVGVNREKLPDVIRRRAVLCGDYQCTQVVSADESCEAELSRCNAGRCEVVLPEKKAAPEGVGVEPIEDPAAARGEATPPAEATK